MSMRSDASRSVLEELSTAECWRLLRTQCVGRLAVVIPRAAPLVVPVNYAIDAGRVLLRSDYGSKVRWLALRHVSFEVDCFDGAARQGWSVLLSGRAREVPERELGSRQPDPWVATDKPYMIAISPIDISGRRVGPVAFESERRESGDFGATRRSFAAENAESRR